MTSIRACVTLVLLALTLSLAATVTAQPVSGPEFIGIEPCRLADTRPGFGFSGAFGPPALVGGAPRNFPIQGQCGIPATATAVAFNFTITQPAGVGWLTVWPAGGPVPQTSMVNYVANEDVANASDVLLGAGGAISVQSVAMTHLVIDVYGYFTDVEEPAAFNTALGLNALASNNGGFGNTALGWLALSHNTVGNGNTATGVNALVDNTTGSGNTATGGAALFKNTTGSTNTAMGNAALSQNTTGSRNIALGFAAGAGVTTGNNNIAIGDAAGAGVRTGSDNIHIGNLGNDTDSHVIRIGTLSPQPFLPRPFHTATFIAGIFDREVGADAVHVLVDSTGKLGTGMPAAAPAASSRRVKAGIHEMGTATADLLKLRPVTFRYILGHGDSGKALQYGLIAEEVAEIYPDLVIRDEQGLPSGVRYHVLPAMLLNELQRQQRERQAEKVLTEARLAAQQQEIDELRAQVRALVGGKAVRE
jgi:Chaperone of endosialidase